MSKAQYRRVNLQNEREQLLREANRLELETIRLHNSGSLDWTATADRKEALRVLRERISKLDGQLGIKAPRANKVDRQVKMFK